MNVRLALPLSDWFFAHVAGNTFGSHEKFLKKMKKNGAVRVKAYEYSSAVVIFCPIFTRFDYDVGAALYDARGKHREGTRAETICVFCVYDTARVTVFVCLPLSQRMEQNHFGGDASHF